MTDSYNSTSRTSHKRQFWIQSTEKKSLWPVGWLFLLFWLLLFLYGLFLIAPEMEAHTKASVTEALKSANYQDYTVTVDGQEVLVEGKGSSKDKSIMHALAASANCKSWGKNLTCPNSVDVSLVEPVVASKATIVKPVPVLKIHDFVFQKTESALLLNGEVPTVEIQGEIVEQAKSIFTNVDNQLKVTNDASQPGYPWAAKHALTLLEPLKNASASWKQGKLSIWGRIEQKGEQAVKNLFYNTEFSPMLGSLKLEVVKEVDRCNQEFAVMLATSSIHFATNRAEISSNSKPLLQRLAELAKTCPMNLMVEGHTDNRGNEDLNNRLSIARAESVINSLQGMGVDVSGMTPRGYGSNKPVANNNTARGRAKNRRIEIKVVDF